MKHKVFLLLVQVREWTSEQIVGLIAAMLAGIGVPKVWDWLMKKSDADKEIELARMDSDKQKHSGYYKAIQELTVATERLSDARSTIENLKGELTKVKERLAESDRTLTDMKANIAASATALKMIAVMLSNDSSADPTTLALLQEAFKTFEYLSKEEP